MHDASKILGIKSSGVSQSCKKLGLCEGYMFRLASDYEKGVNIEPYKKENIYFKDKL